ncbi:NrdC-like thioredoxin [Aeromonas phage 60AhydR15PP]|uniref:Thioredoxin n=1 Tax=Aeromonas phage 60AhydR15PP TaxID=2163979 RepID=A0A2S1PGK3_9CAUD|nr:NrdC-like thioredoxin [Aeromonas phage 60AhydR15PP]AWH15625.1 hypothetical protein [Aeromonas phage 60AhydR15PP]UIW13132.1 hypothetical protein Ah13A_196 [Aeromonas phage AhMtk13a]
MDIEMHIEAQKQIREAEWSARTAKHTRMRELRNAYVEEKEAGRVESELISEDHVAKAISSYLRSNEYDVMLDRRKEVAKQKFRCPCCDTDQIQLVSWVNKVVDLRCRKCNRKFIWESPI